ncbi:type II toxin-antitoxin system ParD family antitoxin [Nocardia tengchongensis]|uniref:type II toxin-antitoxin system ParD family antitoxin n=1 Tax=Nocardia tengchongensis TaxID=2055889 RepID=UPI00360C8865
MAKNTSVSLGAHHDAFIEAQVKSGRYQSASEVVRTALRLLEDRETELRTLRDALEDGERSGEPTEFDFDSFLARKRAGRESGTR